MALTGDNDNNERMMIEPMSREIQRITVVGAGTMGHGISQVFACAGHEVTLCDLTEDKLAQARKWIERNLAEEVGWGLLSHQDVQSALDRIQTTTSLEKATGDADLVIEAVFESLDLKRQLFRDLDRLCPEHTILGSNTSSFMPSKLASATEHPERVLVVHFSFPPPLIPLVEIVRSEATSDDVVEAVYNVLKAAGRSPIIAQKEATGFIINRIQLAILREALSIVERGIATAQDVDLAVKHSFGRRLAVAGPLEMVEVQDGWDVIWTIGQQILPDLDTSPELPSIVKRRIERGELGPKTGKGFYQWTPESLESWRRNLTNALAGFVRARSQ